MQRSFRFQIDETLLELLSVAERPLELTVGAGHRSLIDIVLQPGDAEAVVTHAAACSVHCARTEDGELEITLRPAPGWTPADAFKPMRAPSPADGLPKPRGGDPDHVALSGASGGNW
ncbi:hypothetical protein ACEU07_11555 [Chromobacterium violaceum]|uniref:Uncharacterized protein n=1 Tax=Chromobacterium violaceum TaxID=536 RepID=A0A202B6M5_CHRVL|nr:hypothetical protein [Chromobacterium violaceum]MBA8735624.1 hypothetical protein [Chromobacterium violaceum]MBP4044175.1 hypothetical protein [Chromobacterium violaceum]MBX9266773.1 hypothetical protein [Chromobacterium violaceum]OVE47233.1 hypothetical protein CBW21_14805 [Chromobacterium violaceum]QIY81230.1 hypothetical protein FOB43_19540 [Chromobacterium violaceum]